MIEKFTDFFVNIIFDAGANFLLERKKENELRQEIIRFIKLQKINFEFSTMSEEIDFAALLEYFSREIMNDLKTYLFNININKSDTLENIIKKIENVSYANNESENKAIRQIVLQTINITSEFYKKQISNKDWFYSSEIVNAIFDEIKRNNAIITKEIKDFIKEYNMNNEEPQIDIYSQLTSIFNFYYGETDNIIKSRNLGGTHYNSKTGVTSWEGKHFTIPKNKKDIIQVYLVDTIFNPIKKANMYHYIPLDFIEGKGKTTFYLDNPSEDLDYLTMIRIIKNKGLFIYLLALNNIENKITEVCRGEIDKSKLNKLGNNEVDQFLGELYDIEPINKVEYIYSVDIDQEYITIDIETGEIVRPIAYLDEKSKTIKGKVYMQPHKAYFTFKVENILVDIDKSDIC